MLDFIVNSQHCNRCGLCVADCPARIIAMAEDGFPKIAREKEAADLAGYTVVDREADNVVEAQDAGLL